MRNEHDKGETLSENDENHIEGLLDAIIEAFENDPDCNGSFINEFGDLTIAIPLDGNKGALDNFMEEQKLFQNLGFIAEEIVEQLHDEGIKSIDCCFTGHSTKKIPWLSDNEDTRTQKLRATLKSLIDNLSIHGVSRYHVGNTSGFDTIAAEAIQESNEYLELSKEWKGVPADWKEAKIETGFPFKGNNPDIVVALLNDQSDNLEESNTMRTISHAMNLGKPLIIFYSHWFEDSWPNLSGISVVPPHAFEKD